MQFKPIRDQVVVIVGGSSGIGRETALKFGERGAKVVVAARGAEGLESVVEEIRGKGGDAIAIMADAADPTQMQSVAEGAVKYYGRIDTWVHVAAVTIYAKFEDTTPEEFRQVIEVNLIGQANGIRAALPELRRTGRGALICVSSVESEIVLPFNTAYAASKHGVHGLLKGVRMELQHDKIPISVTEIKPASINTPLFDKARTKLGVKPMGIPPIYPPSMVADAILNAAVHPRVCHALFAHLLLMFVSFRWLIGNLLIRLLVCAV